MYSDRKMLPEIFDMCILFLKGLARSSEVAVAMMLVVTVVV